MTSKNISATAAPKTTAKVGITKTTKKAVTPKTPKTLGNNLSAKAKKIVGKLVEESDWADSYLDAIIYLYSQMPNANTKVLEVFRHYGFDGTWINRISEEELHVLQGELKEVVLYCFHKINQRDHNSYEDFWWWRSYGYRYGSQEVNICVEEEGEDYVDYTIDNGVFCPLPNEVVELCYRLTNPTQGSTIFLPFAADSQFATYLDGYKYEGFESNVVRCVLGLILKEMCGMDAEISYYESPLEAINRVRDKRYDYIFTYLPFYDNIYGGVRDNLRTQFFDLMEQLEDGGEMCCILPYTACFSYEWKDFRKRFIKNEGKYSATLIVLPYMNEMGGLECLFVIKKDGRGTITFMDARAEEFLIKRSVYHTVTDGVLAMEMRYNMNVQAVIDAISAGRSKPMYGIYPYVSLWKFSDLDGKMGLVPHRFAEKDFDIEISFSGGKKEYGEILGNLIDIVSEDYGDGPEKDKYCVYSPSDLKQDWFNCELPEIQSDRWSGNQYRLDKGCLLCAWDGVRFRVGKISDSLVGQVIYLKDGIIPFRIKSNAVSEKFLLMSLASNPTQLIGINAKNNHLAEEEFLSIGMVFPSKEEQEKACEDSLKERVSYTEGKLHESLEDFRKYVHMTKHALGQTIFSLNNWWKVLQRARKEGNGVLNDDSTVTRKETRVADIYENIQAIITQLQKQVNNFDSGDMYEVSEIDLAKFIEYYTKNYHQGSCFNYEVKNNIVGIRDLARYPKFPTDALKRIFDDIINNAENHGFKNREDNIIRIELAPEGFDPSIIISNNGHPIPESMPVEDIFVYGRSSDSGNGHSGIGGHDIRQLMQDYGGDVKIVSSPNEEFPVAYKLIFHNIQFNMRKFIEENFRRFDPKTDGKDRLPDVPGNYILVLRKGSHLPEIGITPVMETLTFDNVEYEVVYTGISKDSLRSRDYKKHFTGNNAGVSTLRKSLGSLMGFKKIPRDKNNPDNGRVKFGEADEMKLSEWMANNLLLFYHGTSVSEVDGLELKLIDFLNPPLNLKDNHNPVNSDFRNRLSDLRK